MFLGGLEVKQLANRFTKTVLTLMNRVITRLLMEIAFIFADLAITQIAGRSKGRQ